MKNCTHCKHALWKRTDAGRLHPSGDGECSYAIKVPPLPPAFVWMNNGPRYWGGHINRREELREHCPYFARSE